MKILKYLLAACATALIAVTAAAQEAPNTMIERLSNSVLDSIKQDRALKSGDINRVMQLVDTQVMPAVDFQRMTALAVGPAWRQATPDQRAQLEKEFKTLLVRTYSGALNQVSDQSIVMKPFRAAPADTDVVVNTEVRGRGDPVQLDYRLRKGADGSWKIYNVNVLGVWLVESYRSQFQPQITSGGIDGLIKALAERNQRNAAGGKA